MVRPILRRLLSRAAADLLDEPRPLEALDEASEVIVRDGDLLRIDVGAYPPFVELMNRELRLLGGHGLFPFRAIVVHGVRIEEGRLVILTRIDPDQLGPRRVAEGIEALEPAEGEQGVEVQIVPTGDADSRRTEID